MGLGLRRQLRRPVEGRDRHPGTAGACYGLHTCSGSPCSPPICSHCGPGHKVTKSPMEASWEPTHLDISISMSKGSSLVPLAGENYLVPRDISLDMAHTSSLLATHLPVIERDHSLGSERNLPTSASCHPALIPSLTVGEFTSGCRPGSDASLLCLRWTPALPPTCSPLLVSPCDTEVAGQALQCTFTRSPVGSTAASGASLSGRDPASTQVLPRGARPRLHRCLWTGPTVTSQSGN